MSDKIMSNVGKLCNIELNASGSLCHIKEDFVNNVEFIISHTTNSIINILDDLGSNNYDKLQYTLGLLSQCVILKYISDYLEDKLDKDKYGRPVYMTYDDFCKKLHIDIEKMLEFMSDSIDFRQELDHGLSPLSIEDTRKYLLENKSEHMYNWTKKLQEDSSYSLEILYCKLSRNVTIIFDDDIMDFFNTMCDFCKRLIPYDFYYIYSDDCFSDPHEPKNINICKNCIDIFQKKKLLLVILIGCYQNRHTSFNRLMGLEFAISKLIVPLFLGIPIKMCNCYLNVLL